MWCINPGMLGYGRYRVLHCVLYFKKITEGPRLKHRLRSSIFTYSNYIYLISLFIISFNIFIFIISQRSQGFLIISIVCMCYFPLISAVFAFPSLVVSHNILMIFSHCFLIDKINHIFSSIQHML